MGLKDPSCKLTNPRKFPLRFCICPAHHACPASPLRPLACCVLFLLLPSCMFCHVSFHSLVPPLNTLHFCIPASLSTCCSCGLVVFSSPSPSSSVWYVLLPYLFSFSIISNDTTLCIPCIGHPLRHIHI